MRMILYSSYHSIIFITSLISLFNAFIHKLSYDRNMMEKNGQKKPRKATGCGCCKLAVCPVTDACKSVSD